MLRIGLSNFQHYHGERLYFLRAILPDSLVCVATFHLDGLFDPFSMFNSFTMKHEVTDWLGLFHYVCLKLCLIKMTWRMSFLRHKWQHTKVTEFEFWFLRRICIGLRYLKEVEWICLVHKVIILTKKLVDWFFVVWDVCIFWKL